MIFLFFRLKKVNDYKLFFLVIFVMWYERVVVLGDIIVCVEWEIVRVIVFNIVCKSLIKYIDLG